MRKVLAVFMSVLMLVSAFSGVMTVSAADVTTTIVEIPLGDLNTSTNTGTLTATDYVKSSYTFGAASNGKWGTNVVNGTSNDAKTIVATYAEPKFDFSVVNTSELSKYSGIATGHSAKLLKFTQTANFYLFRLKDFYDVSKLPTKGTIRLSVDVYPTDITPGTKESTTETGVKSGTGTLNNYKMRIVDSTGSSEKNITATAVTANQWNTITHEMPLSTRSDMNSVRIDVQTGIQDLAAYTNAFPATVFYDKLKIEYIGPALDGDDSTGNTGVVAGWETLDNFTFESEIDTNAINIWGNDGSNVNHLEAAETWEKLSISKPNTTEEFGSQLLKADSTKSTSTKGLDKGRMNPFADFAFKAGETYKLSIWAYLAGTTSNGSKDTATVVMVPYCGSASSVFTKNNYTLTMGQWKKLEYEVVATSEHDGKESGFRFEFKAASGTNYPTIIYFDNGRLEKKVEGAVVPSTSGVKANVDFEDGDESPSSDINIWGKDASDKNVTHLEEFVNWADETSISKPNSTDNFGSKLLKADGRTKSVKGVHTGRINDIPASTLGITAGKKYTYSFWVLAAETSTAAGTAKVELVPYINGSEKGDDLFCAKADLVKGEWKKVSGSFVATAENAGMSSGFRIRFNEADSTNYPTLVYMDNFTITEGEAGGITLTVTAEGNGTVTGGGEYAEGEKATLVATPGAGYTFVGWYNGSTLISDAATYEYTVTADVTSIVGKFEVPAANIGDNWVTIDEVDFEGNVSYSGTPNAATSQIVGSTAKGLSYTISALDAASGAKVTGEVLTEAQANVGTSSSNHIYKFTRGTNGTHSPLAMMRVQNFFDMSNLSVGDIIRVTSKVYATDFYTPDGVTATNAASLQMFLSVSGKYGSGSRAKVADSTGSIYIKNGEWTEIGFTTTVTQEMLDAITDKMGSIRIDSAGNATYPETIYLDDVKAEVYKDYPAADKLDFVENFDSAASGVKVNDVANVQYAPYIGKVFTRKDSSNTYTKFYPFGTGAGSDISLVANAADLSGVTAHSGHNALKWAGRFSANGGIKIGDIFMGKFDKDDIGKKIRVSAWIYADKSAGAYKLAWDEASQKYVENSKLENAEAYSEDEVAEFEKTMVRIAFGGPNDNFYEHRSGNYNARKFDIKWNEWTEIYSDIIITEDILDNGITTGSATNPLISALRIDQYGAEGLSDSAVVDTFYIDDISVKEVLYEVSAAIGDHMVYQKGRPIRVWGINGDIGEVVTVKFNGVTKTAATDENGNWVAEFDKIDDYTRNLTIEVSCPGERDVTFTDVSIGEVILASGQSNMEWNLRKVYEAEDIIEDAKTNENISILSFESDQHLRGSYEVLKSPKGAYWSKKDKATAEICSGVGYITAYKIQEKYNIPVAVIDANLSGSAIKAWLPAEVIEARKDTLPEYEALYEEMVNKTSSVSSGSIWKQVPAGMYNSFIAPLDNYEVGVMLWYQGCSDSSTPLIYNYYQYDLINSWRALFGAEDTPFVICQLAPYSGSYMALRQVQLDTAKRMDDVYLVTTADLGPTGSKDEDSKLYSEMTDGNEIHPVRKIPVADRIAKTLFANYFGEEGITYSGPEYTYMEAFDDHIILHFKHIGTGLKKIDEEKDLTGFKISADNETFVDAKAEILADNTIKVYADDITNPKYVRYCYVNWVVPENALTSEGGKKLGNTLGGNLTNESGIPAGPFVATLPAPTIYSATTSTDSTGINISMAIRNMGYSEANPRLIVALYNSSKLIGLKSESVDFKTIDAKTFNFKFYSLTSMITDQTAVKAFLWNDMGSMIPLQGVYDVRNSKLWNN